MNEHPAFMVEEWSIRELGLHLDSLAQTESIFALSNGHIGLRGNLDEGEPHGLPGTYLNSFYELRHMPYAEGSPLTSVNANWALSYQQSSSDHDCPCVPVVGRSQSHANRTPRPVPPDHGPFALTSRCRCRPRSGEWALVFARRPTPASD